jgi:hypothetical protein
LQRFRLAEKFIEYCAFEISPSSYLLLFHQLRVRTIVDNIVAKNGGGEWRVNLLGANIAQFSVQNEVVTLGTQVDSGLLAQEDKCKDIAILWGGRSRGLATIETISN